MKEYKFAFGINYMVREANEAILHEKISKPKFTSEEFVEKP
jgi:hypothetical protein